jgi:hypothetical protein
MTLLSEVPIFNLALAAEKRHGEHTHMVIEAIPKDENANIDINNVSIDDVVWWVEFEDQVKTVNTFDEVSHFFMEEVVASSPDAVV